MVLAPGPAQADSRTRNDPAGDVTSVPNHSDVEDRTLEPARREGDLVSTTVRHRKRTVLMVGRYRELTQVAGQVHFFVIRTNEHRTRRVGLFVDADDWQGTCLLHERRRVSLSCPGVQRSIDYQANVIRVVVPRRCLSRPRWVRVRIETETQDATKVYDDAAPGRGTGPWTFGPRVRR